MSHFIEAHQIVEAPPIFELQSKQIVKPKTDKIAKGLSSKKHRRRKTDEFIQKKYMQGVYAKLMEQQKDRANVQSAHQIKQSYINLKNQWNRSCEEQTGLSEFFQTKRQNFQSEFRNGRNRLNLKTVYGQMPKKVELIIKHNNKIMLKYGSVHELEEIRQSKEKYKGWLDKTNNHISKSPIFKNMSKIVREIQLSNSNEITPFSTPVQISTIQRRSYQGLSRNKKKNNPFLGILNTQQQKIVRSKAMMRRTCENI